MKKNSSVSHMAGEYGMIVLGSCLYVIALNVFITPMQIPSGGLAGITLLLNYILGTPIGVMTIVLNVPLLFLGYRFLGKDFFFKTMFMTVFSSVLIDVCGFIPAYKGDILLACIFGGIFKGLGFGLIIKAGGTSGGADVLGKYLYRSMAIPMGSTSMAMNILVLLASAYFLNSLESLLYGIIMTYVVGMVMDRIIYGGDVQKNAMIITCKPKEISDAIMKGLGHGVTAFHGTGMYTGADRVVLMCIVRPHEAGKLKKLILSIDETAFMMLSDVNEVLGKGFKPMSVD